MYIKTMISVFSDGVLKQRFLFSNLHLLEGENAITLSWKFSVTSRDNGIVDGIGGMVMSAVWCYVRSGKRQCN